MNLPAVLLLALAAGISIPAGAVVHAVSPFRELCLRHDIDSFVSYFGGGALLAAIALVLVPYGADHVAVLPAGVAFFAGGLAAWQINPT